MTAGFRGHMHMPRLWCLFVLSLYTLYRTSTTLPNPPAEPWGAELALMAGSVERVHPGNSGIGSSEPGSPRRHRVRGVHMRPALPRSNPQTAPAHAWPSWAPCEGIYICPVAQRVGATRVATRESVHVDTCTLITL